MTNCEGVSETTAQLDFVTLFLPLRGSKLGGSLEVGPGFFSNPKPLPRWPDQNFRFLGLNPDLRDGESHGEEPGNLHLTSAGCTGYLSALPPTHQTTSCSHYQDRVPRSSSIKLRVSLPSGAKAAAAASAVSPLLVMERGDDLYP